MSKQRVAAELYVKIKMKFGFTVRSSASEEDRGGGGGGGPDLGPLLGDLSGLPSAFWLSRAFLIRLMGNDRCFGCLCGHCEGFVLLT